MNRSRRIYKLAVILTFALGAIAGAYNDPPIAIIVSSPDFYPLAQFVAGVQGGSGGGASYDPDNLIGGIWYGYNHGITSYDWSFSPNPQWWNYSTWNHSGVYFKYSSVGKKIVYLTVEDDDSPTGYGSTQCNVWVFEISASLSQSVIGVGDTATLTMNYSPSTLPGYEKLTLNTAAAGVVEVLDGTQTVISGSDYSEAWPLPSTPDPCTVTVKGCSASPIQAILWLQFTPNGSYFPGSTYNGNSVSVSVVGVYQIEVYASQWYDVTDYTITVL